MSPSYDRAPAVARSASTDRALEPRFDEQDTIGNSAVLEGLAQPALEPSEPGGPDGIGSGEPTCPGGRDDDVLALRMATDMAQGGSWWRSQAAPACHAAALDQLQPVLLPLAVTPAEHLTGAQALEAFEAAARSLEGAASAVDPAWVAQWYRPTMRHLRHRLMVDTAMDSVERQEGADADPSAVAAAIEALEGELTSLWGRLGLREAKVARKGANEFLKSSEEVIAANPVRVWNPRANEWAVVATFDQMVAWLALVKVVLMAAEAGPRAAEAVTTVDAGASPADRMADGAGQASAILEGVAGVAGTTSLVLAKALRLASLDSTLDGASLLAAATRLEGVATAIGRSKSLSGVLGVLSVVRNGAILFDADSTVDQRADAFVGVLAGTAEVIAVTTGSAAAGWAAVAIPATWWAFKTIMMELGDTRLGVTGALLVREVEELVAGATAVVDAENKSYAAWLVAQDVPDADWAAAYGDGAKGFAAAVPRPANELWLTSQGWRAQLVMASVAEVMALHERALAHPHPESMHAFAVDLADRVSSLLEDLPHLVGVESGIRAEEPPARAQGLPTSPLEQLPTE